MTLLYLKSLNLKIEIKKEYSIKNVIKWENHPSSCSQSSDHPSKDVSPERKARRWWVLYRGWSGEWEQQRGWFSIYYEFENIKLLSTTRFSANINLWNHYLYWRTVPWDSKQRPLRKKIPQWRGQALFQLTNEKWSITRWLSPLYHVVCITSVFRVIQTQVHNKWENLRVQIPFGGIHQNQLMISFGFTSVSEK